MAKVLSGNYTFTNPITGSFSDLQIAVFTPLTSQPPAIALHQSGLLTAVEDYVADSTDLALKIEWAHATEIRRTWPPVAAFAQANEISDADLDALFELAAAL